MQAYDYIDSISILTSTRPTLYDLSGMHTLLLNPHITPPMCAHPTICEYINWYNELNGIR
jgi:hypothetical protein